ncbi:MAG TPA: response regulator, partial [Polyangiaceae bacterium]|nr:response regulator [Polyangiaceae bacterium]
MARVLIIEGDDATRSALVGALCDEHETQAASEVRTGLFRLTAERWDVVVLDPTLESPGHLQVAPYIHELPNRPEVIVVADPGELERVAATFRAGAFEFVPKPIDFAGLRNTVANAAQMHAFRAEKRRIEQKNRDRRAQLEALVKERTQQMEQIFANVPGMVYRVVVHPDGFRWFSFVSSNCRELLELSQEQLAEDAELFDSLVHGEDIERFEQTRDLAERTRTRLRFEGRFSLPSGRTRWLQCVAQPTLLASDCVAWDGLLVDVTERMELQSQLLLSDRLATVGTMAASVAHEVNNPLFYISSNLESLSEQLRERPGSQALNALVDEALDGVSRIENAMKDLRTFARSPDIKTAPISVTKVLDASVRLASNEIRHRAQLIRDYRSDAMVVGDESSIGQLFLNLLVVAAQSIPEGNAHSNELIVGVWVEGREVNVEISDTGPGILRRDLERAFDPFADVSERMRSGMGLYVCQRIVGSLGGQISARSRQGSGNTFHVRLPAAKHTPLAPRTPRLRLVPSRPARVLIVDDEELVLKALRRTLEGHDVRAARSGREAIQILETEPPFDLVLCDVMMPDMNGEDVYNAASRVAPGTQQRIVFVTGGAFTKDAN